MKTPTIFNALCYEMGLFLIRKRPSLAMHPLMKTMLAWCKEDWTHWRASKSVSSIDTQAAILKNTWEDQERKQAADALAATASCLHPDAKITPIPNAIVPSVLIEVPPPHDASDHVKALGGEIRITRTLDENHSHSL